VRLQNDFSIIRCNEKKERQDFVDGAPRVPDLQGSIVRA
jgi:hypothetical protein